MKTLPSLGASLYGLLWSGGVLKNPYAQDLFNFFYFKYKKYAEDPFSRLVKSYPGIFQNGHLVDVGANTGYTALLFASAMSGGFKLFAFEPEEQNFNLLTRGIRNRNLEGRIVPLRAAIGNTSGTIDLWANRKNPGDHRVLTPDFSRLKGPVESQKVPIWKLDDLLEKMKLAEPIVFIKVDVQGYEGPVCEGMTDLLRRNPRVVVALEYFPLGMRDLGFEPRQLLDFFRTRNFLIYTLRLSDGLRRSDYSAVENNVKQEDYVDLIFSPYEL
ncbi:MAG: hypothetical protein A2992_07925 [Elusimicrobia bacterium RIFCSPLOWO2_01_FULL_59_12]|nr:MAG: hypothetical protein A2992_07925 [Elusimicrobia bacterium RIFCSPLOWO2_01_FULL_59_12]